MRKLTAADFPDELLARWREIDKREGYDDLDCGAGASTLTQQVSAMSAPVVAQASRSKKTLTISVADLAQSTTTSAVSETTREKVMQVARGMGYTGTTRQPERRKRVVYYRRVHRPASEASVEA